MLEYGDILWNCAHEFDLFEIRPHLLDILIIVYCVQYWGCYLSTVICYHYATSCRRGSRGGGAGVHPPYGWGGKKKKKKKRNRRTKREPALQPPECRECVTGLFPPWWFHDWHCGRCTGIMYLLTALRCIIKGGAFHTFSRHNLVWTQDEVWECCQVSHKGHVSGASIPGPIIWRNHPGYDRILCRGYAIKNRAFKQELRIWRRFWGGVTDQDRPDTLADTLRQIKKNKLSKHLHYPVADALNPSHQCWGGEGKLSLEIC